MNEKEKETERESKDETMKSKCNEMK